MIEIKNLEKVYDTGDHALKGVDLEVSGSEFVTIIGPSGAGKSTLIRCINQLVKPTNGQVYLDDTELTALSGKELRNARRDIGMIFQEFALIERLTVMENILSGRLGYVSNWAAFRRKFSEEDIVRARETLNRVGLDQGFENKRADELSGGQRQRIGIARAVVQRPKMLLVDEPTSSLDPATSHAVMDLLTDIAAEENIPVIMNIHEVPLAKEYTDRLIGLRDGEIVFRGTPDELTEDVAEQIYGDEELGGIGRKEPADDDVDSEITEDDLLDERVDT